MAAMLRRTLHDAANLVWRSRASGMRRTLRLLGQVGVQPATIADVGASDGRWSQLARAAFPAAELVLFEPHLAHAAGLERFKTKDPTHGSFGALSEVPKASRCSTQETPGEARYRTNGRAARSRFP